jgi:hypothetical protein
VCTQILLLLLNMSEMDDMQEEQLLADEVKEDQTAQ